MLFSLQIKVLMFPIVKEIPYCHIHHIHVSWQCIATWPSYHMLPPANMSWFLAKWNIPAQLQPISHLTPTELGHGTARPRPMLIQSWYKWWYNGDTMLVQVCKQIHNHTCACWCDHGEEDNCVCGWWGVLNTIVPPSSLSYFANLHDSAVIWIFLHR